MADKDAPRTGDGINGGNKPKTKDLAQVISVKGTPVKLIKQPSKGWGTGSNNIGGRHKK